jgi:hypothetical protein
MAISSANVATCQGCGQPITGKFCGNCGTEAAAPGSKGAVSLLVGEFGGSGGQGYLYTLKRLLRSPLKATLELTENPGYRGYKGFFLTSSAIGIAAQSYAFRAKIASQPPEMQQFLQQYGDYYSVVLTVFQYATVFGGFLLGYWFYRRFSKVPRTAHEYFKLTCLAGGFGALISALFGGIELVTGPAPAQTTQLWSAVVVIPLALFAIYYGLGVQKRFWDFSVLKLIFLSFALFVIVMVGVTVMTAGVVLAVIAATG